MQKLFALITQIKIQAIISRWTSRMKAGNQNARPAMGSF